MAGPRINPATPPTPVLSRTQRLQFSDGRMCAAGVGGRPRGALVRTESATCVACRCDTARFTPAGATSPATSPGPTPTPHTADAAHKTQQAQLNQQNKWMQHKQRMQHEQHETSRVAEATAAVSCHGVSVLHGTVRDQCTLRSRASVITECRARLSTTRIRSSLAMCLSARCAISIPARGVAARRKLAPSAFADCLTIGVIELR